MLSCIHEIFTSLCIAFCYPQCLLSRQLSNLHTRALQNKEPKSELGSLSFAYLIINYL